MKLAWELLTVFSERIWGCGLKNSRSSESTTFGLDGAELILGMYRIQPWGETAKTSVVKSWTLLFLPWSSHSVSKIEYSRYKKSPNLCDRHIKNYPLHLKVALNLISHLSWGPNYVWAAVFSLNRTKHRIRSTNQIRFSIGFE